MENFNIDIRQTKKWDSFFNWWHSNYRDLKVADYDDTVIPATYWSWSDFPFEFQSGVYIKYIEEELKHIYVRNYLLDDIRHQLCTNNNAISSKYWDVRTFNTLEELILYTFNE